MKPLDLQSEQYSATGNVASEGVLNQLGRPNLDTLTVLVREAVQNSWDARASDNGTVRFGMTGRTLALEQAQFLREVVFKHQFGPSNLGEALSSASNFEVLTLYDRGTTGLGGPTRADKVMDETESSNFVNLLRNVGWPTHKRHGGGTFGYGKAALYLASRIRTLCVHTHCYLEGQLECRFMGSSLGNRFEDTDADQRRSQYTGRHWWGRKEEGIVEPVRGAGADEIAQMLGLPEFTDKECGTTILILLPQFGERSLEQSLSAAAGHLLWNCWPKMLTLENNHPAMAFELAYEGHPIRIPDPSDFPPLHGFVQAMKNLKSSPENGTESALSQLVPIDCHSPKQRLGQLSLQKFGKKQRQEQLANGEEAFPISEQSHHVALMRTPELVVKYMSGPPLPVDVIEYAGVFITSEQVDDSFAQSEPPTHDDWVYQSVESGRNKTFVRVALRRIQEALQEFTRPVPTSTSSAEIQPLGAFADRLGSLLLGFEGPGAAVQPFGGKNNAGKSSGAGQSNGAGQSSGAGQSGSGGQSSGMGGIGSGSGRTSTVGMQPASPGGRKARIHLLKQPFLELVDDTPALMTEFMIDPAPRSQSMEVSVEMNAVLDDNELEKDPPAGGSMPQVLFWSAPDKTRYPGHTQIVIPASSTGPWVVAVSMPDAVISINLVGSEVL